MADAPIAILQSFGALTLDNVALITNSTRSIANIVPHVTLEETSSDTLSTTDHPVETGAAITDHSFRNPAELEMRLGWSDTTAQSEGFCQVMYQQLLALQQQRMPFPIQTGKRAYQNMLFRSLTVKTDQTSEYALMVVAGFREIIIVHAASGGAGGTAGGDTSSDASSQSPASDPDNQAEPQQTAPTQSGGAVSSTDTGTQFDSIGRDSQQQFADNPPATGGGTSPTPSDAPTASPYGTLQGITPGMFGATPASPGGATFGGSLGSQASPPSAVGIDQGGAPIDTPGYEGEPITLEPIIIAKPK